MDIEVARGPTRPQWRTVDRPPEPLAEGEARLRIDRFGFSSNNVTYAVMGDLLRYWDFFPPSPADRRRRHGVGPGAGVGVRRGGRDPFAGRRRGRAPLRLPADVDRAGHRTGTGTSREVTDVSPHRAGLAAPVQRLPALRGRPGVAAGRRGAADAALPPVLHLLRDRRLPGRPRRPRRRPGGAPERLGQDVARAAAHLLHGRGRPDGRPDVSRATPLLPVARGVRRRA